MIEDRSPFPGMDPYLEPYWRDVHTRLCTYSCDALQPQIRPQLLARLEERLVIESDIDDPRSIYPDVKVVERRRTPRHGDDTEGGVAVAEPLIVRGECEPAFEGFIQIIDGTTHGKLATVIEFLSPSNKYPGENQQLYLQKHRELAEARVSLVEIDLLRGGQWTVQTRRDPARSIASASIAAGRRMSSNITRSTFSSACRSSASRCASRMPMRNWTCKP